MKATETNVEVNENEVQVEEKKKFFTKEKLKRIGIITGGALIGGLTLILGLAFLGNRNEDSLDIDSEEENDENGNIASDEEADVEVSED